ncbi:MAG: sigma 54-interacting transcriptional regulator [Kofleriaceae bacterium]
MAAARPGERGAGLMGDDTTLRPAASTAPPPPVRLALTIAAHPDPTRVGHQLVLDGLAAGREVSLSRHAPDFVRPGRALGAPLADPYVSRTPIRFATAPGGRLRLTGGGTAVAVDGVAHGGLELGPVRPGDGITITLADRVVLVLHALDGAGRRGTDDDLGMIGVGAGIAAVREAIRQVLDLSVPVLVRGETGTGKELVARALHERGPRRAGPFVSVNLGAIPKDLAAAELFGAVRGAYSGAVRDRAGLFRSADGGTLFLDEIGEAPPEVQVMLLRVLETGELYPVGGHEPVAVDVRLVSATDADLDAQLRDGRFKASLFHRMAGHEIHVPPLRTRPEDIGVLLHHFARVELAAIGEAERLRPSDPHAGPWLPPTVASRLIRFAWPGNVRQLRNVTRQLVITNRGRTSLELEPRLDAELTAGMLTGPEPRAASPLTRRRPADLPEAEVLAALRASAWDLKAAADQLGIPRSSMYDIIERCPALRTAGELSADEISACHQACDGDLDLMAAKLEVSRRALQRRVRELGLGRR